MTLYGAPRELTSRTLPSSQHPTPPDKQTEDQKQNVGQKSSQAFDPGTSWALLLTPLQYRYHFYRSSRLHATSILLAEEGLLNRRRHPVKSHRWCHLLHASDAYLPTLAVLYSMIRLHIPPLPLAVASFLPLCYQQDLPGDPFAIG